MTSAGLEREIVIIGEVAPRLSPRMRPEEVLTAFHQEEV